MSDEQTVWYRKWRPQTFAGVFGQEHVTRTLRNAVATGRIPHAILLTGPRGTGKTTNARLLAKAVNCANPVDGEPCDACDHCIAVRENRALDLVEMDAASNRGIDDIRGLRDRVGYSPTSGRYKVYLIDEVHELTQQAFDALLKTLEEPPPHVIFVLATTDAHKVPATILSRCMRFDLTRAKLSDLTARLRYIAGQEGLEIDDAALTVVARAATGSFRDGVNLLEQLAASFGHTITVEQAREGLGLTGDLRALDLARHAVRGDLAGGLGVIAAVRDDGVDLRQFTREVAGHLRGLLLLSAGAGAALESDADTVAALRELAAETDTRTVARALKAFATADFRADPQASLPLELALTEVALAPATTAPLTEPLRPAEPSRAAPGASAARPSEPALTGPRAAQGSAPVRPVPAEPTTRAASPSAPASGSRPDWATTDAPAATGAPAAFRPAEPSRPAPGEPPAGPLADNPPARPERDPFAGLDARPAAGPRPAPSGPSTQPTAGRPAPRVAATNRPAPAPPPFDLEPPFDSEPPPFDTDATPPFTTGSRPALDPRRAANPTARPAASGPRPEWATSDAPGGSPARVNAARPASPRPASLPATPVASAEEPAPSVAGAGGPLTLDEARARYREVYETLRKAHPIRAGMINGGDFIDVTPDQITIGVPHSFLVAKLAPGGDANPAVAEAVRQVFGHPYRIHCVHQPEVDDRLRAQPARPSHLVDEALKLGGRLAR